MKKLLLIGALAAVALVQAQPSQAYFRGKWCAKLDNGGGSVGERCDFPNFETCRAYVNAQIVVRAEPVARGKLGPGWPGGGAFQPDLSLSPRVPRGRRTT
jgi:hypothetical protein